MWKGPAWRWSSFFWCRWHKFEWFVGRAGCGCAYCKGCCYFLNIADIKLTIVAIGLFLAKICGIADGWDQTSFSRWGLLCAFQAAGMAGGHWRLRGRLHRGNACGAGDVVQVCGRKIFKPASNPQGLADHERIWIISNHPPNSKQSEFGGKRGLNRTRQTQNRHNQKTHEDPVIWSPALASGCAMQ